MLLFYVDLREREGREEEWEIIVVIEEEREVNVR